MYANIHFPTTSVFQMSNGKLVKTSPGLNQIKFPKR